MTRYVRDDEDITGDPSLPLLELFKVRAAEIAVEHSSGLDYDEARARAEVVFGWHLADPPRAETMNRIIDEIINFA